MRAKYSKQVFLGRNKEGKEVRKRIYANSESALREAERKARNEFERAGNPSDITFKEYADRWLDVYKGNREPSTIYMYRSKIALCEDIFAMPMNKLTRTDYQKLVTKCSDHPNTAKKLALTLMQIIRSAALDGIIPMPAWKFEVVKYKPKEKEYLSDDQMIRIFELDLPIRDKLFVRLIGTFGLRPQEAFALSRDSFRDGSLIIDKAVGYDGDRPYIKGTKNEKSRVLPVPEAVSALLALYFADFRGFYLFGDKEDGLMTKYQAQRYSRHICDAIGINNLYILRHTVATKLYYKVSPKLASYYMGHSEQVFISTYSHLDRSRESLVNVFS